MIIINIRPNFTSEFAGCFFGVGPEDPDLGWQKEVVGWPPGGESNPK